MKCILKIPDTVQEEKVERVTSLETIQRVYEFLLKVNIPKVWQNLYSKAAIEERKRQEKREKGRSKHAVYNYGHLVGERSALAATKAAFGRCIFAFDEYCFTQGWVLDSGFVCCPANHIS